MSRRAVKQVLLASAVLLLLAMVSLLVGRVALPSNTLFTLWRGDADPLAVLIITELRLPRTVLALLVGAALGLSGAVLQGLTRNPLAEPGLLGVSSGAALGAVIAIHTGLAVIWPLATPLLGLAGAFAAALLTLTLGRGEGVLVLILAGSAVSGVMFAATALALNLAPNPYAAYEISMWLMGSLADRSWDHVWLVAPFLLAGLLVLAGTGRALDALSLGEQQATSLGINLRSLRLQVLLGTALAVGAATAVAGAIGFIGLLAPHWVRPWVGHEPRRVLWPATVAGAALLLAADIGTRLLPFAQELKLGVLTVLVGTPFFVSLLLRLRRSAP